jgi:hypothetical protein
VSWYGVCERAREHGSDVWWRSIGDQSSLIFASAHDWYAPLHNAKWWLMGRKRIQKLLLKLNLHHRELKIQMRHDRLSDATARWLAADDKNL